MKILIVGGGAAGMMAACSVENNHKIVLIEKNEKLGKKLYITGKGRCNITNNCSDEIFYKNIVNNSKFLMSSYNEFNCKDTIDFFMSSGLKLKTERGNRVFPESDKSSDIIKVFENKLKTKNVDIRLNTEIKDLIVKDNTIIGIATDKENIIADRIILATGGKSYSLTGSTGDGYKFAEKLGHKIIPPKPALVPIILKNIAKYNIRNLSLKNVTANIVDKGTKKIVFSEFGEMLINEKEVSGPIILTLSSKINRLNIENFYLELDLKPALNDEKLDNRMLRDIKEFNNKKLCNLLCSLVPKSLIYSILDKSNIDLNLKANELNKSQRKNLLNTIKHYKFDIECLDNINKAIITSGGICTKEINPKTMESKLIKNLFLCGELIDVDALTGGFNLQIALTTGHAAGKYASKI